MKDGLFIMDKSDENLGEELYNLLTELLNREVDRTVIVLTYQRDGKEAGI